MTVPLATLDSAGWLSAPSEILAKLFEYYKRSEKSQSNTFSGVSSLPYTLSKGNLEMNTLESDISNDLQRLFSPYFDNINIRVSVVLNNHDYSASDSKYDIQISGNVSKGGASYNIAKLVSVEDNKVIGFQDVEQ